MFPASIPYYFIHKYTKPGDTVLDPFSGRGTTALEACLNGRKGIGNDLSIMAWTLTKAKVNMPPIGLICDRLDELQIKYRADRINLDKEQEDIKIFYSDYTLKQLVYLKKKLNLQDDVDVAIMAFLTGIMHGQNFPFLSTPMPSAFSMAKNYVKNYAHNQTNMIENELKAGMFGTYGSKLDLVAKPERDVFKCIKYVIAKTFGANKSKTTSPFLSDGQSLLGSAMDLALEDDSVDLTVSSPPYLGVLSYGRFNWIRLWLYGMDEEKMNAKLSDSLKMQEYLDFMLQVINELHRVTKDNGVAVLVIGDVEKKKKKKGKTIIETTNLAQAVWDYAEDKTGFKLKKIVDDPIRDHEKVTQIWGDEGGKATKIDRCIVMYKGDYHEYIEDLTMDHKVRTMF